MAVNAKWWLQGLGLMAGNKCVSGQPKVWLLGRAVMRCVAASKLGGWRLSFTFSNHAALHLFEQLYAMNFLGATDGLKSEGVDGESGDGPVLESCGA